MAVRGQRFTLDPDSDNFTFNIRENSPDDLAEDAIVAVKEIRERETSGIPPPPKPKQAKTAFPLHRSRGHLSAFKSQQQHVARDAYSGQNSLSNREPSDRAIINHVGRKYGIDTEAKEKAEISEENKRRIAQMSVEDIEEARSEIMANLSPAFIERFLRRANIEEDRVDQDWSDQQDSTTATKDKDPSKEGNKKKVTFSSTPTNEGISSVHRESSVEASEQEPESHDNPITPQFHEATPSMHFPVPPRNPDDFVPLNPDAPSFLSDLKKHYFPDLPDDPSTLTWLQDPTEEESNRSPYAPTQSRYAPSDIRFDFTGRLLAPNESRDIPVSRGLHHHGEAPESAGYTIPELSILARSTLPNQRCIAYQVLGRVLYRLGRGDFGQRGTELQEGLWGCVEKERPIEIMMSEANRTSGHVSAKAYATEALWLWRKGGGGERGLLKPGERVAK